MTDKAMLDILSTFSQATDKSKPLTEGKRTVTADTAMADILGKLQQLNEGAEGKMPSKKHVMDMCKDGKSEKEMLEMHADADKDKLKDLIKTCKEEMKDSKEEMDEAHCNTKKKRTNESAIAEGVAQIEERLLKEFAEFAEAHCTPAHRKKKMEGEDFDRSSVQSEEVMPFVKMTYKEIQDNIKRIRQEIELGHREDIKMLKPRLRDLLDQKDVVASILNSKGRMDTESIIDNIMDSGLDTSVREELGEIFKKQVAKDPQLAKKLFKNPHMEGKKKDHDGDGDIDSNDYLAARDKAIKAAMAKKVDEAEFEVDGKKYKVTEMFDKHDEVGSKKKTKHGTAEKTATGMKHTRDYKPDYLDLDGDGDKKEPMKKASKDKKAKENK